VHVELSIASFRPPRTPATSTAVRVEPRGHLWSLPAYGARYWLGSACPRVTSSLLHRDLSVRLPTFCPAMISRCTIWCRQIDLELAQWQVAPVSAHRSCMFHSRFANVECDSDECMVRQQAADIYVTHSLPCRATWWRDRECDLPCVLAWQRAGRSQMTWEVPLI